jgi:beta-carotene ketolase (CrtW type)
MTPARQSLLGTGFAVAVIATWVFLHVWGVFFHRWSAWDWVVAPAAVLAQTWLGAAMFIVAHDAIHGSLAPGRARLNAVIGQAAVGLYAGFSFRKLSHTHAAHHVAPGTEADPDFHAKSPTSLAPWLRAFIFRHFGLPEFARLTVVLVAYIALGAGAANLITFWAVPAALSALQLFYFGTYLPHRWADDPFADEHRARSLPHSRLWSFLTCLNFGACHHEHHLHPHLPWWRLPEARWR